MGEHKFHYLLTYLLLVYMCQKLWTLPDSRQISYCKNK